MTQTGNEHEGSGRARPPKRSQFKKGQSGNPAGRPKKTPSFKADLAAELRQKICISQEGGKQTISKQKAFCRTLVDAAIKKDIRAINALLACMRYFGVGAEEEETTESIDLSDLDLLETYVAQQRKQQERSSQAASSGTPAKAGNPGR